MKNLEGRKVAKIDVTSVSQKSTGACLGLRELDRSSVVVCLFCGAVSVMWAVVLWWASCCEIRRCTANDCMHDRKA